MPPLNTDTAPLLKMSRNGLIFLACREALVLTAYPDGEHHSIGFGHNDPNLKPGDTITIQEAFALLRHDIIEREKATRRALTVPVRQGQFDALVDLRYQSGNRYAPEACRLVNENRIEELREKWPHYSKKKDGTESDGLRKRRILEWGMFERDDYGDLSTILLWHGNPRTTKPENYKLKAGDIE